MYVVQECGCCCGTSSDDVLASTLMLLWLCSFIFFVRSSVASLAVEVTFVAVMYRAIHLLWLFIDPI